MRNGKTLGLTLVAAIALLALASSASAVTFTSPTGTVYKGPIEFNGGAKLHGSFVTVECNDAKTVFDVEEGVPGEPLSGPVTSDTYSECNYAVTVSNTGSIVVDAVNCNANNECTATLTSTGMTMSVHTSIGVCIFTTGATDIGTLTPTNDTGGHAVVDTPAAKLPRSGGSFLCGSSATLTKTQTVTKPTKLWINP